MPVSAGREFLSIPGPTVIPDAVLAAMQKPAVDIYAGPLVALTDGLLADMSRIFNTAGRSYIYAANGHGAWEAALTNVLSRGDKVLVLESGRFAIAWGEAAKMLGAQVEVLSGDIRRAVQPEAVEAKLKADRSIKAILVTQVDTASGVQNDIEAIGKARDAAGSDALLLVDAVASLGCMPFEMDKWGVDVAMAGSQKGLMTPPGLSFTAAGPRAREAHKRANMRTPYWDWTFRDGEAHYHKYCGTPPEHLLFGLRAALDMIFAEGLENVFARHRLLAEATRRAVSTWAEGQAIGFNCSEPEERSDTVTTVMHAQRRRLAGDCGLLPRQMRRGARPRARRARGQGVSDRAHGPRQRADDLRHAQRGGDGARGAERAARQGRRAGGGGVPGEGRAGLSAEPDHSSPSARQSGTG